MATARQGGRKSEVGGQRVEDRVKEKEIINIFGLLHIGILDLCEIWCLRFGISTLGLHIAKFLAVS